MGTRFSLQTVVQKSHTIHGKMYDVIIANTAGTKRRNICYKTLVSFKNTAKTTILENYIQEYMNLKRVSKG